MRGLFAIALGLLFMGLGLYAAAAVTPIAFPGAYDAQGGTTNVVALFVMLSVTLVATAFAGWITARLADDHLMGHAVMMGTLGLASAVFMGAIRWAAAPPWYWATSWILIPVASAIGAAAWRRTLRRTQPASARRVAAT
jgi:hypothetical protein